MNTRLTVLMRDYGYRVDGSRLVSVGVRGFTSDTMIARVRSIFDAAEYLLPIIADDEYASRFLKITNPIA